MFEEKKDSVIGIPYYTEADWMIQRQNSVDDSGFKNYEEMKHHTEKLKKDMISQGYNVVDVKINAAEMQEYFEKKGIKNNSSNRSRYVAEILRSEDEPKTKTTI
jgi:hypothetical protein